MYPTLYILIWFWPGILALWGPRAMFFSPLLWSCDYIFPSRMGKKLLYSIFILLVWKGICFPGLQLWPQCWLEMTVPMLWMPHDEVGRAYPTSLVHGWLTGSKAATCSVLYIREKYTSVFSTSLHFWVFTEVVYSLPWQIYQLEHIKNQQEFIDIFILFFSPQGLQNKPKKWPLFD